MSLIACLRCLVAVGALLAGIPADGAALRILMLGNSYTDSGASDQQVWRQLQSFLNADPAYAGSVVSRRAPGGWQLYNHAYDPTSTNLLTGSPPWDYVILQDQSYTPSHAWLYGGELWDVWMLGLSSLTRLARNCGAKVIYYETWARDRGEAGVLASDYLGDPVFMQDNLFAAYNDAGGFFGVKVALVGEAWELSLKHNPELTLHQKDRSHMNNRGAYLAAAVFYRTLTGKDPAGVPYTSTLSEAEANTLRANLNRVPFAPQPASSSP